VSTYNDGNTYVALFGRDGAGNASIYVDGNATPVATASGENDNVNNTVAPRILGNQNGTSLNGQIDYCYFYPGIAPSAALAAEVYNSGSFINIPDEPTTQSVTVAYADPEPTTQSVTVAYADPEPTIQAVTVAYTEPPNAAPVGTPNPLNASVTEGSVWSASNTITITDSDANPMTVTLNGGGTKPAWVTDDFDDTGATSYPTGTVLTFGGTPPYTGAGSNTGSPYSWSYNVFDGIATTVVTVNLTVNNFSTAPVATPDAITVNVVEGKTSNVSSTITDGENETVDITVTGGSEPSFLNTGTRPALAPTEHPTSGGFVFALEYSPVPGDAAGSPYTTQYTFTDESGQTDVLDVTINVTEPAEGSPLANTVSTKSPVIGVARRTGGRRSKGF
jgi:hypothetical protein